MGSVERARWGEVPSAAWSLDAGRWRAPDAALDLLVGIDEAGRGPLAGPVSVAAVALAPTRFVASASPAWFATVDDSKKLTERRREALFGPVAADAAGFAIVHVHADHIDAVNILRATLHGMAIAVELLLGVEGPSWPGRPTVEVTQASADTPPLWYEDALRSGGTPTGAHALVSPLSAATAARLLIDGNSPILVDGSAARAMPQEPVVKGDALSIHIAAASILAKVSRDHAMIVADELWPGYGLAGHKGYPTPSHKEAVRTLGPSPLHRRSFAGAGGS